MSPRWHVIRLDGPFNLSLSLEAAASFLPPLGRVPRSLRLAVQVADRPAIVEIRQRSAIPPVIEASATIAVPRSQLEELALWLTSGDLNLRSFYLIAAVHPRHGPNCKAPVRLEATAASVTV